MERDLAAALSDVADSILSAQGDAALSIQLAQTPEALGRTIAAASLAALRGRCGPEDIQAQAFRNPWFLLTDAFVVDDLPETPTDFLPVPDCKSTLRARLVTLGLHALLQVETIAYRSENNGSLFVNLVAVPGTGRIAEKSIDKMRGHTDAVSFPFPGTSDPNSPRVAPSPDFVTLVGLKNPNDVPTRIMPLDSILQKLNAIDITELEKPQFTIEAQHTFRRGTEAILGATHRLSEAALLHHPDHDALWVRFSHSKVAADHDSDAANRALLSFAEACAKSEIAVKAIPGSILLINNRGALHGRPPVGEGYGRHTRWLLRTYALRSSAIDASSRYPETPYQLFP